MKLKAFLQLQKSEIQSLSHTDNGITIGIIIFISLVLGQLIDRRVNRDLYQHQDQDQDNQEL